ncbi:MAG: hypothetical protein LQ342_007569 [Letrouitia transgressa]|nr:MAG: hypothetical protein LQ342_007569 [Letrouitia transgressa]
MRFLCLHGKGTSASIFKSQTTTFRAKLPAHFTFDFHDGFLPSSPAAGIDLFYPPPYYSFWNEQTPSAIRTSHAWLDSLIARQGPYDGVMCFSQGCSLIASYCLYHQSETPSSPLPFKVAIFICGGVPFLALEDLGVEISERAREINNSSSRALSEQASADSILASGSNRWIAVDGTVAGTNKVVNPANVFGLDFTRIPGNLRIKIPTVHVFGSKDPRYPASLQLVQISEGKLRKTYDHGGGHDVPRNSEVSERIAELVEWSGLAASLSV